MCVMHCTALALSTSHVCDVLCVLFVWDVCDVCVCVLSEVCGVWCVGGRLVCVVRVLCQSLPCRTHPSVSSRCRSCRRGADKPFKPCRSPNRATCCAHWERALCHADRLREMLLAFMDGHVRDPHVRVFFSDFLVGLWHWRGHDLALSCLDISTDLWHWEHDLFLEAVFCALWGRALKHFHESPSDLWHKGHDLRT